jgi:hypothetical protein
VVINNFDIPDVAVIPDKTHAQKIQSRRRVQLLQLTQGDTFKVGEPGNPLASEKHLGIAAFETLNHVLMITGTVIKIKSDPWLSAVPAPPW